MQTFGMTDLFEKAGYNYFEGISLEDFAAEEINNEKDLIDYFDDYIFGSELEDALNILISLANTHDEYRDQALAAVSTMRAAAEQGAVLYYRNLVETAK